MRRTVMGTGRRQVKAGNVAAKGVEAVHVRHMGHVGHSRHMGHVGHSRHSRGTMMVWSMMRRAVMMMRRRHGSKGQRLERRL